MALYRGSIALLVCGTIELAAEKSRESLGQKVKQIIRFFETKRANSLSGLKLL